MTRRFFTIHRTFTILTQIRLLWTASQTFLIGFEIPPLFMTLGINDLASAISPPSSPSESCRSRLELELIALPVQSASCLGAGFNRLRQWTLIEKKQGILKKVEVHGRSWKYYDSTAYTITVCWDDLWLWINILFGVPMVWRLMKQYEAFLFLSFLCCYQESWTVRPPVAELLRTCFLGTHRIKMNQVG